MINYDFYVNSYLGSDIPEKVFPRMAARAWDALCHIRQKYRVKNSDTVSEKMALCAMAETLYAQEGRKAGVSSATVGGVSVRYENSAGLQKLLLSKARIYLDIYRGAAV